MRRQSSSPTSRCHNYIDHNYIDGGARQLPGAIMIQAITVQVKAMQAIPIKGIVIFAVELGDFQVAPSSSI